MVHFYLGFTWFWRSCEFELNFFPFHQISNKGWWRHKSVIFSIGNITPPKFLFIVREVWTMDGVRISAFSFKGLFASEKYNTYIELGEKKFILSYTYLLSFLWNLSHSAPSSSSSTVD